MNIYDTGVADESLPKKNNDDAVTVNYYTVEKSKNENIDYVRVADEYITEKKMMMITQLMMILLIT